MLKSWHITLATAATAAVMSSSPASAGGNIFLTGHDTDYHAIFGGSGGTTPARTALTADIIFVRNGSTLPVLVLDKGSLELSNALTALGVPHVTMDPATITDAAFDPTLYSAMAVASNVTCGGCDLTNADLAALATHTTAINAFFNAGAGILGLSGASDLTAYAYVPEAAANAGGSPPSTGYVETLAGTSNGLVAENGDATHNFFPTPGTGGLSSAYQIAEILPGVGGAADRIESIFVKNGTIICTGPTCTITGGVPEPASWAMMLLGFGAIGWTMRRKRPIVRFARA